jgi:hypothetical protein
VKLIEDLRNHAAGLDAAADATEQPALQARLMLCAKVMRQAAKVLEYPPDSEYVPAFLRKQAH